MRWRCQWDRGILDRRFRILAARSSAHPLAIVVWSSASRDALMLIPRDLYASNLRLNWRARRLSRISLGTLYTAASTPGQLAHVMAMQAVVRGLMLLACSSRRLGALDFQCSRPDRAGYLTFASSCWLHGLWWLTRKLHAGDHRHVQLCEPAIARFSDGVFCTRACRGLQSSSECHHHRGVSF